MDYLMYAILQTARYEEARALLCRIGEIEKAYHDMFVVAYTYVAVPAAGIVIRRCRKYPRSKKSKKKLAKNHSCLFARSSTSAVRCRRVLSIV